MTPGHPLFEATRRHTLSLAREAFQTGAAFYSLQHEDPVRIDFYRARVVDGLGHVIHERLFTVEIGGDCAPRKLDPAALGNMIPAAPPEPLPDVASIAEPAEWMHTEQLRPFLEEVRGERVAELDRIAEHIELSLTELLQRADDEIGRAAAEVENAVQGAEGRMAQAETRHADLLARRDRRRRELEQQRALTLQAVERIASALVLPHPEQGSPDLKNLRPDFEVEAIAMRVAMEHEEARGCQVTDVHEQNLGYDITSMDPRSGELRLIEVKGIGAPSGTILLTPNERRVAEDRRDCYWLYVVVNCRAEPVLETIEDPARLPWHEVKKVAHYYLTVDAAKQPTEIREDRAPYDSKGAG